MTTVFFAGNQGTMRMLLRSIIVFGFVIRKQVLEFIQYLSDGAGSIKIISWGKLVIDIDTRVRYTGKTNHHLALDLLRAHTDKVFLQK